MNGTRFRLALAGLLMVLTVLAVGGFRPLVGAQSPDRIVVTLAGSDEDGPGDGTGATARFAAPSGITLDRASVAYVVDGNRIRRISPTGDVTTIAGTDEPGFADGPLMAARFDTPLGIAVDGAGTLYIADTANHRIRTISPAGIVTTLAGSGLPGSADGAGAGAQFNAPYDVAVDAAGMVYVADALNHRIRRISPEGVVTTLAGDPASEPESGYVDGPGAVARFSFPNGIAIDAAGTLYVADTYNARIRAISPSGEVRTVAGSGEDGDLDGPAVAARFADPAAIAVASDGALYVVDKSHRVRLISPDGLVSTLAGSGAPGFAGGPAATAQFDYPEGLAVNDAGAVYIADTGNRRIRLLVAAP